MCRFPGERPPVTYCLTAFVGLLILLASVDLAHAARVILTPRDETGAPVYGQTTLDVGTDGIPVMFTFQNGKMINVEIHESDALCPDQTPATRWRIVTTVGETYGWLDSDLLTINVQMPHRICWTKGPAGYTVILGEGFRSYAAEGPLKGQGEYQFANEHLVIFPIVEDIPTLTPTGIVILASLLVGSAAWFLRRTG